MSPDTKLSLPKTQILGVHITNATSREIIDYVFQSLKDKETKLQVVTPNPEIVVYANKHKEFKQILNQADISLADGVGITFAGRMLGKPLKERITGVDFMLQLCDRAAREGKSVGLLGAQEGVAAAAAEKLQKKYPGLQVVFVGEEWSTQGFEVRGKRQEAKMQKQSYSSNLKPPSSLLMIDLLFVAYGFPKQEQWIAEHLEHLPVKVAMGVGGAFDYISGNISRAPKFVRRMGLEWLYRLVRQPWRWKRQLALLGFFGIVIEAIFNKTRSSK